MKILFTVLLSTLFIGCSSIRTVRYRRGQNAGLSDYDKALKSKKIGSWRMGYIKGLALANSLEEFRKSSKDLKDAFDKADSDMELMMEEALEEIKQGGVK